MEQSDSAKSISKLYRGIPYKGKRDVINIKDADPEDTKPQVALEAHYKVFCLKPGEDNQEYQDILSGAVTGKSIIGRHEIVHEPGCFLVYIHWSVYYYDDPS